MKTIYKIITYTVSALLFLFLVYIVAEIFFIKSTNNEYSLFTVEKGISTGKISENLKSNDYIKDKYAFLFYVYITGGYRHIQAGKYLLSPSMSISQIANMLINGETAKEKITIIEGWDLRDLADYFEKLGIASKDEFYQLTGQPTQTNNLVEFDNDILKSKPNGLSIEGYIFPDTYYFEQGESIKNIIEKTIETFDEKLTPEIRQAIQSQNKSIFEILTMASLIEKEVKTMDDKKTVSGILWNRLEKHMPLQVDATVLYATGKENSKVYINDTKFDSRYNTYKYGGLPLGPICNPGIDSIMAAINPIKSSYLYYLSAPDGKTYFSKTLEEHNYYKNKYLR